MIRRHLFAPILGTSILAAAVVLAAWPNESPEPEPQPIALRPVQVAAVTTGDGTRTVRLPGMTRAARRAELSFSLPARLASRPVETGDRVIRGQVIASLDDREFRFAEQAAAASMAELEVRLAQARRDLDRVRRLAAARAATDEEVEQTLAATEALEAARNAASAQLAETRRLLAEATLRAPFAGTVTGVHAEPGEWVGPGKPIVELAGAGSVEIMVEAPETVAPHLSKGQRVSVDLPFTGTNAPGRITSVSAAASGPGGLFPIEVTIDPHRQIVPGLTAEVILPVAARADLTVPLRAVLNPGSSQPSVFVIRHGRASRVSVELGQLLVDRVAVTGALQTGDLVAIEGHLGLADGDAVEVF